MFASATPGVVESGASSESDGSVDPLAILDGAMPACPVCGTRMGAWDGDPSLVVCPTGDCRGAAPPELVALWHCETLSASVEPVLSGTHVRTLEAYYERNGVEPSPATLAADLLDMVDLSVRPRRPDGSRVALFDGHGFYE